MIDNLAVEEGGDGSGRNRRIAIAWPDHIEVVLNYDAAVLCEKTGREFRRNQTARLFLSCGPLQ